MTNDYHDTPMSVFNRDVVFIDEVISRLEAIYLAATISDFKTNHLIQFEKELHELRNHLVSSIDKN